MITLAHPNIETKIVFDEQRPTVLICENPHEYYNLVTDLVAEFEEGTSNFSFWKGLDQIKGEKYGDLLLDNFCFDLANKKLTALLQKRLRANYVDGSFLVEFNRINSEIAAFLHDLCRTVDFATDFEGLSIDDLLKCCAVRPATTFNGLLEKVVCYVNLFIELKKVSFFVFVGLKDVLSDEDLQQLYNHCRLMKVGLLLLESSKKRPLLPEERGIIITDDLCELTENFEND